MVSFGHHPTTGTIWTRTLPRISDIVLRDGCPGSRCSASYCTTVGHTGAEPARDLPVTELAVIQTLGFSEDTGRLPVDGTGRQCLTISVVGNCLPTTEPENGRTIMSCDSEDCHEMYISCQQPCLHAQSRFPSSPRQAESPSWGIPGLEHYMLRSNIRRICSTWGHDIGCSTGGRSHWFWRSSCCDTILGVGGVFRLSPGDGKSASPVPVGPKSMSLAWLVSRNCFRFYAIPNSERTVCGNASITAPLGHHSTGTEVGFGSLLFHME